MSHRNVYPWFYPLNTTARGEQDALGLYGKMQILVGAEAAQGDIFQTDKKLP